PLTYVRAIERPGRFTAIPFSAPWLRGVTAVRGSVVSVVDLGTFAGNEPAGLTPGARLVVVQTSDFVSALLVDRTLKITSLPASAGTLSGSAGPLSPWWAGIHRVDGETVYALDLPAVIDSPQFRQCQLPSGAN
ncbi:MAG TPA: chemotaxis protein CheW, partial [Chloroflexota bacterium]|nr:chemotaxis protein CheW [Chloroflexota bacterium]